MHLLCNDCCSTISVQADSDQETKFEISCPCKCEKITRFDSVHELVDMSRAVFNNAADGEKQQVLYCCNTHPTNIAAEQICLNCNYQPLCATCIKTSTHNDHTLVHVDKWFSHMHKRIALNLKQAKERLAGLEQEQTKILKVNDYYKDEHTRNEQELKQFFDSFANIVQQASIKAMKELNDKHQARVNNVNQAYMQVDQVMHAITTSDQLFNEFLNEKSNNYSLDTLTHLFKLLDEKVKVCI